MRLGGAINGCLFIAAALGAAGVVEDATAQPFMKDVHGPCVTSHPVARISSYADGVEFLIAYNSEFKMVKAISVEEVDFPIDVARRQGRGQIEYLQVSVDGQCMWLSRSDVALEREGEADHAGEASAPTDPLTAPSDSQTVGVPHASVKPHTYLASDSNGGGFKFGKAVFSVVSFPVRAVIDIFDEDEPAAIIAPADMRFQSNDSYYDFESVAADAAAGVDADALDALEERAPDPEQ